ncbi:MAG: DNA methyltransferase, partial [Patescibacteria group bacterium]|nr:DNA methyltransferase [Patescibacteria group bacterium]
KKINSRWVTSREKILSSVVVGQNKLTSSGIELSLIAKNDKLYIGETLAVQPFKELSFRDYGRPYRDDFSGMLPPKLAQIMLNLSDAKTSDIILDPFCGSGTILSEALLMKFENVIGSDISKKAIDDSRRNIQWINKNWEIKIEKLKLYNSSAAELSKKILPKSIDAIITEPYLGPQRGKINIRNAIAEIETLYSKTLNEFKKILKPNGRIAIIFPIFRSNHGSRYILPELSGYKIINLIPKNLRKNKNIYLTKRDSIIYGRPGQKIWREIIILQKNNLKILFNLNSKN